MTSRDEALKALEKAVEMVAKATPGPWLYRAKSNTFHSPPPEGTNYSFGYSIMADDTDYPTFKDEDIDAILAAVNFIREHGAAILSARQEVAPVAWGLMYPDDHAQRGQLWNVAVEKESAEQMQSACWNAGYDVIVPLYTSPAHTSEARDAASILAWAVERWHAEVAQRPLVNIHRRSLDDCWRQVVRRCGEDDVVLLGPRHDDLVAAMRQEAGDV